MVVIKKGQIRCVHLKLAKQSPKRDQISPSIGRECFHLLIIRMTPNSPVYLHHHHHHTDHSTPFSSIPTQVTHGLTASHHPAHPNKPHLSSPLHVHPSLTHRSHQASNSAYTHLPVRFSPDQPQKILQRAWTIGAMAVVVEDGIVRVIEMVDERIAIRSRTVFGLPEEPTIISAVVAVAVVGEEVETAGITIDRTTAIGKDTGNTPGPRFRTPRTHRTTQTTGPSTLRHDHKTIAASANILQGS